MEGLEWSIPRMETTRGWIVQPLVLLKGGSPAYRGTSTGRSTTHPRSARHSQQPIFFGKRTTCPSETPPSPRVRLCLYRRSSLPSPYASTGLLPARSVHALDAVKLVLAHLSLIFWMHQYSECNRVRPTRLITDKRNDNIQPGWEGRSRLSQSYRNHSRCLLNLSVRG